MKQHLLRVERPVVKFRSLIAALRHEGERTGWLELPEEAAEPLPDSLATAADAGVLRAVAAGGDRCVVVKPMRGEPVLRDLLREHFRGCRVVLVMGKIDAPLLEPIGAEHGRAEHGSAGGAQTEYWNVKTMDGSLLRWKTVKLISALRGPRPFDTKIKDE